ncbi:hypothetical protein [Tellurirhabdus rosea]|uniref:hypothetical protein n=1 Tax=Tellurirhabdus rosea TaxID=2674997 RepID=UPI0022536187|nr:hypothetical protein [Tellurirhabdus rosea]
MNLPTGALSFSLFVGNNQGTNCQLKTYRGELLYYRSDRPFGTQQFFREARVISCDMETLFLALEPCTRWNRSYYNTAIADGEQWEVVIHRKGQETRSFGSNAYPEDFDRVLKTIEAVIDEKIPFRGTRVAAAV